MAGGVSPYWKYPGVLNGRIQPTFAFGQGVVTGQYFYEYYYSTFWSYYTDHVFCLGEDSDPLPLYWLSTRDGAAVYQTDVDLTGLEYLNFCWNLRTSQSMPTPEVLVSSGQCTFQTSHLLTVADAQDDTCQGIELPAAARLLTSADTGRLLQVAGTTSNDGTYCVLGVPMSLPSSDHVDPSDPESPPGPGRIVAVPGDGQVQNGRVAILQRPDRTPDIVAENASSCTLTLLGIRWVARAYIDDVERVVLRETRPGRSWQRNYMALHVSKAYGMHQVRFTVAPETYT